MLENALNISMFRCRTMGEGQHEMLGDVANLCWYLQVENTKHAPFKGLHFTIWSTSYLANFWWPDPGKTHCDTGLKSHMKTEHEVGGYLAAGSPAGFWWGEPGKRGSHFLDSSSLSLLFLKTSELINISLVWQVSLSQLSGVFGQLFSWPVSGH